MPAHHGLEVAIVLWGLLVLAAAVIKYYYFDGQRIQIDLPRHRGLKVIFGGT
jgi:hypothetical protein